MYYSYDYRIKRLELDSSEEDYEDDDFVKDWGLANSEIKKKRSDEHNSENRKKLGQNSTFDDKLEWLSSDKDIDQVIHITDDDDENNEDSSDSSESTSRRRRSSEENDEDDENSSDSSDSTLPRQYRYVELGQKSTYKDIASSEYVTESMYHNLKLLDAVIKKNIVMVSKMIKKKANANYKDEDGQTPLHLAVKSENMEIIKLLIKAKADITEVNDNGQSLLHIAVKKRNLDILKFLIEAKVNVNAVDDHDQTPLHLAVKSGNIDILKLLIKARAHVDTVNDNKDAPLRLAVRMKNEEIVKLLVNAGANLNVRGKKQQTLLHEAALHKKSNILTFLIDSGANVNARDDEECTPLHRAAYVFNEVNNFKILMDAGAKVNVCNKRGDTPFTCLIEHLNDNDLDKSMAERSVELTLQQVDVNLTDKLNKNVLKNLLKTSKNKFFYKILEHVSLMKALNLYVDPRLLNTVSSKKYNNYFVKCLKELEKAKSTKLHQCWVTIFNILSDGERKLVKYAGNKDLVKDVNSTNLVQNFPIYGPTMKIRMLHGVYGREQFDNAAIVLSKYLPRFNSTHLIIKDLLETLEEEDWRNLKEKKRGREF